MTIDNLTNEDELGPTRTSSLNKSGAGLSIPRVLFIELESGDKDIIYLLEELEEFESLPSEWDYLVIDEAIVNQSIVACRLRELRSLIVAN